MAKAGVDFAKVIDINHEKAQGLIQTVGPAGIFLEHVVQRTPVVDFGQRVAERLQSQKLALNGRGKDFRARAAQFEPHGNHIGVEENQQYDQPHEKLARNRNLKMHRPAVHDGAGDQNRDEPRRDKDSRDHHHEPLLEVALLQTAELLAQLGENAIGSVIGLHA